MICFTEVRFLLTYSPLRWSRRPGLFQPFPSLKRSLRPSELLFSIKRNTKFPQGPPHNWCLLPWLQLSMITRRMRKKRSDPSARAQMNTNVTLSSHYLVWSDSGLGRGFDLFGVSRIEWYSSCNVLKVENLDYHWMWGGWGIYSPNHQKWPLEGCCRMAHRTVRCASNVSQPLGFDRWSSDLWGLWAVRWCTGQVL
jgi:hypothetical protein